MRLIDADALKDEVMKIWAYIQCVTGDDVMDAVMTDIKNAPTVDAVQVVRCRDCKHFELAYYKKDGTENFKYKRGVCCRKKRGMWVPKDWFCADGERGKE